MKNIHVLKACTTHKWRKAGKKWECTVCGRTTGINPETIEQKLAAAIRDEEDDIAEYRKAAQNTDPKTAKLLRHIGKQEVHHKEELTNRLKQIR